MSAKTTKLTELKRLQAENRRLKAENERLSEMVTKTKSKKSGKNPLNVLRRVGIILLVGLAVALLTVGNIFFWTGNTVVKQDRYVAATSPIITSTSRRTLKPYCRRGRIFWHRS
jgi:chromosome condensin MukBEF MukE localization factor